MASPQKVQNVTHLIKTYTLRLPDIQQVKCSQILKIKLKALTGSIIRPSLVAGCYPETVNPGIFRVLRHIALFFHLCLRLPRNLFSSYFLFSNF